MYVCVFIRLLVPHMLPLGEPKMVVGLLDALPAALRQEHRLDIIVVLYSLISTQNYVVITSVESIKLAIMNDWFLYSLEISFVDSIFQLSA